MLEIVKTYNLFILKTIKIEFKAIIVIRDFIDSVYILLIYNYLILESLLISSISSDNY